MIDTLEKEERYILLLSSLLHDIGKLVQRASEEPAKKKHEEWGADWFATAQFSPQLISPALKNPIESLIYNHHTSSSLPQWEKLLQILQQADRLSAGERPEKEDTTSGERGKWEREVPLRSIISEVHLEGKPPPTPTYWTVQPLTSSFVAPQPREIASASGAKYRDILNHLNSKLKSIHTVNSLLALLERLLTFVPSETKTVLDEKDLINPEKDPDISLYDHLKLTSAIALCLYDAGDNGFLIVKGDISGVQKFIYTISSKGALKSLRARSLYLELLSNHIPALILERCNLPPTNLIFCGGAHFTLLLPNIPQVIECLESIKREVNGWLWERFRGKLYLALQWVPLTSEELKGEGLADKQEEIASLVERDKLRKFSQFSQLFQPLEVKIGICRECREVVYECDVCNGQADEFREIQRREEEEERIHLCPLCYSLFELGGEIPKLKRPCFVAIPGGEISMPGNNYRLIEADRLPDLISRAQRIFLINGKPEEAPAHFNTYFLPLARYIKLDNEGNAYDFDQFAEASFGAKRIGVLRLDVDHLGQIMSRGLGESYSFSRIATLSRFLTIFFKIYIDDILKGKNVAVVYSGGDDAFIVGSWSDVLESAFGIQGKFTQFTQNPSFTISAGFLVSGPKVPLYQLAIMSGELEESAKNSGRNSLALFFPKRRERFRVEYRREPNWEECYKIKEWKEELLRDFGKLEDGHYDLELPRSLIYRLLEISREFQRGGGKDEGIVGTNFYPYIYLIYILGRVSESLKKKGRELGEKWAEFSRKTLLVRENIPHFMHFAQWLDLLLREKGGES